MELKVILTNESKASEETSSNEPQQQPQTTNAQQKINSAKQKASASNVAKSVMTTAFSVAQTGLQLYNTYSTITNSLEGNSAYSQYVARNTKLASEGLNIVGSFLMGTAMSGGNVAVGGASAIITGVSSLINSAMEVGGNVAQKGIDRTEKQLASVRLGSANNIWRK